MGLALAEKCPILNSLQTFTATTQIFTSRDPMHLVTQSCLTLPGSSVQTGTLQGDRGQRRVAGARPMLLPPLVAWVTLEGLAPSAARLWGQFSWLPLDSQIAPWPVT